MTTNKQNKSKIKTLTEMKSFSLLFSLKANSCMFWTRPQVHPKASCIHKMWLPWLIMGSGELQQEVILDNPVNALSQKVAIDMKVAKGSTELIAVNLL